MPRHAKSLEIQAYSITKPKILLKRKFVWQLVFSCLVRPQVEYCSSCRDPRPGVENNCWYKIERIQRHAAEWRLRRYNNTYSATSRLEDLEWRTLEQRQIDIRITSLFKVTRGLFSVNSPGLLHPVMRRTHHSHLESFIPLQTSLSYEYLSFFLKNIYS